MVIFEEKTSPTSETKKKRKEKEKEKEKERKKKRKKEKLHPFVFFLSTPTSMPPPLKIKWCAPKICYKN